MGWYLNYHAWSNAPRPNGVTYTPVIRLSQVVGEDDYTYEPNGAELQAAIDGNPGATWYIGNEPDRRDVQDDMLPHLYARAYHELYALIKGADPNAHVIAGTIVQPTPVRLLYLDMVLDSYRDEFGEPLPTDGWSVHNFILNEASCDYYVDCWGAGIPPGIDWPHGELLSINDNDDFDRFVERIWRFRTWMRDRGYNGLPLYVSEYGILMPIDYGFNPTRVNDFMNTTFDFMRTATDPHLGNPNDEYRLVQRWSWYSAIDTEFNGWLFDPTTYQMTAIGSNYAAYTAPLTADVDLFPATITSTPIAPFSSGAPVTVTLTASIANGGNRVDTTTGVVARFYDGDPAQGGTQIGSDQVVQLAGCGDHSTVSVTWHNVPPGAHPVYVVVDPEATIAEADEMNNTRWQTILVASERALLPGVVYGNP
jgi:hypothetical protein